MKKNLIVLALMVIICSFFICPVSAMRCYYRQLNVRQKQIYQQMFEEFYVNHNRQFLQEVKERYEKIPVEQVVSNYRLDTYIAYSALINDNPEIFWTKSLIFAYTGGNVFQNQLLKYSSIEKYRFQIVSDNTIKEKYQNKFYKSFAKAVRKIDLKIGKKKSNYKKILEIHNYLCRTTKYDYKNGARTELKFLFLHTSYGPFVRRKAVCDGYAFAMKELCDYYKIPCMIIYGKAKNNYGAYESHVWNIVKLKKKWYMVDCTWDDATGTRKWFLCGRKIQNQTHRMISKNADVLFWDYFSYPRISKSNYKK